MSDDATQNTVAPVSSEALLNATSADTTITEAITPTSVAAGAGNADASAADTSAAAAVSSRQPRLPLG